MHSADSRRPSSRRLGCRNMLFGDRQAQRPPDSPRMRNLDRQAGQGVPTSSPTLFRSDDLSEEHTVHSGTVPLRYIPWASTVTRFTAQRRDGHEIRQFPTGLEHIGYGQTARRLREMPCQPSLATRRCLCPPDSIRHLRHLGHFRSVVDSDDVSTALDRCRDGGSRSPDPLARFLDARGRAHEALAARPD